MSKYQAKVSTMIRLVWYLNGITSDDTGQIKEMYARGQDRLVISMHVLWQVGKW